MGRAPYKFAKDLPHLHVHVCAYQCPTTQELGGHSFKGVHSFKGGTLLIGMGAPSSVPLHYLSPIVYRKLDPNSVILS